MIVAGANEFAGSIHNRMPAFLAEAHYCLHAAVSLERQHGANGRELGRGKETQNSAVPYWWRIAKRARIGYRRLPVVAGPGRPAGAN
jgi:hypothetical protein